jgi:hypothetical protein
VLLIKSRKFEEEAKEVDSRKLEEHHGGGF